MASSMSRISEKNVKRLQVLSRSPNPKTRELAGIVLDVARVMPGKRNRLQALARDRRDLLRKLDETGLILAHRF